MGFDNNLSADEIKVFLDEAEELLDTMEKGIIKMEEDHDPSLLQDIFRAAHTLKGSSATLGHQRLTAVTHATESVFDRLRNGELEITPELTDVLFSALDAMRALADEVRTGEEAKVEIVSVLGKLRGIAESGGDTGLGGLTAPGGAAPGAIGESQDAQAAQETVEFALEPGEHLLGISVSLAADTIMPAVRAYQVIMNLNERGRVLDSHPSIAEIEEENVGDTLEIVFATREPREIVRQALVSVPDVASVDIKLVNSPRFSGPIPGGTPATPTATHDHAGPDAGAESSPGKSSSSKVMARSVRVDVGILDSLMNLVGELVIDRTRLSQIVQDMAHNEGLEETADELGRTGGHIGQITAQLQEYIMKARMVPLDNIFKKFPRMVRDLAMKSGKKIDFIVQGEETELDRSVIQEIGDPLIHILRNAVDHGIESPEEREQLGKPSTGTIRLSACHRESRIVITVEDDGRGIDPSAVKNAALTKGLITEDVAGHLSDSDAIDLIFASGLSTSEKVSEISGRGVGMDVVKKNIEKVSGTIEIETEVGKGTEFRITLPLTLAILRALLVTVAGITYAIPLSSIKEIVRVGKGEIKTVRGGEVIMLRDSVLPLFRLRDSLGDGERFAYAAESDFVVIVDAGQRRVGLGVDTLIGEREVVLKSLSKILGDVPGIAGATILGDGSVALIVDVLGLTKGLSWHQARIAV